MGPVVTCEKAERDGCWYSVGLLLYLFPVQSRTPSHGMGLPRFSVSSATSVLSPWKHPHGHTHRCFSLVIAHAVRIIDGED